MLQLVGEIHNTQAMILLVTSHIESARSGRKAEEPLAKLLSFTPGFNRVVKVTMMLLTVSTVSVSCLRPKPLKRLGIFSSLAHPVQTGCE